MAGEAFGEKETLQSRAQSSLSLSVNCLDTTVMGNVPALKIALQAGISSISHVS